MRICDRCKDLDKTEMLATRLILQSGNNKVNDYNWSFDLCPKCYDTLVATIVGWVDKEPGLTDRKTRRS